jgi:CRP/FNR family cyclic AMP-dependent transcriptional regulator
MRLDDEAAVLRGNPLFEKVDGSRLKLLAFTSDRQVFEAGDTLFHEGDAADAAFVILSGEAEVVTETATGPMIVAVRGRNDIVGEMAILCDMPRTLTIRAKSRLETLAIEKTVFRQVLLDFPEITIEVARVLAERLAATTTLLTRAMDERVGRLQ